ncbi:MAG: hypothetical protein IJO99_07530 [Ruminococcus sp.]|nr:hypothetical protein [Ruminococcus sp.]MBQ9957399.1 hypothetical protein [Ruminococcus sp.]
MLTAEKKEISSPPQTYSDWLECFEILRTKNVTRDTIELLKNGKCIDSDQSIEFLETQLLITINAMIKRYIDAFRRDLNCYMMYNEYDGFNRLFYVLAKKLEGCMFFVNLDFMSTQFRRELYDQIKLNTEKFWKDTYDSLYAQCVEYNNIFLEDELFLIKRIKLFRECECIEI